MKRFFYTVVVLALIGGAVFASLNYHFILFNDSLRIMEKYELGIQNTFVDARGAKALHIATRPDLVKAGIKGLINGEIGLRIPLP